MEQIIEMCYNYNGILCTKEGEDGDWRPIETVSSGTLRK